MPAASTTSRAPVLAIDVGATSIKVGVVSRDGELLDVRRLATPYPCSPERLVNLLVEHIAASDCELVGVGFPGDLADGRVVEPGNLSRPGGIMTDIDESLHQSWLGVDLQSTLRNATHHDVRVVNDATLAALGCAIGEGRELVFTLGTGFGIALVVDGLLRRIRDVGAELFRDFGTYDQVLGDVARMRDPDDWQARLVLAVHGFVAEFDATVVHLGGGNARRVAPEAFALATFRTVVNDNDVTLRGALKLFRR